MRMIQISTAQDLIFKPLPIEKVGGRCMIERVKIEEVIQRRS